MTIREKKQLQDLQDKVKSLEDEKNHLTTRHDEMANELKQAYREIAKLTAKERISA